MLDGKKIAGVLMIVFAAAAGYTVFGGETDKEFLKAEFADGGQSTYYTQERELKITLQTEGADLDKVICRSEGTDGKEKWDAGSIHWLSDTEGKVTFKRQGWYRVTVEYGEESYSLPEFCLETERPEKPETDTGSYKQGTWTSRPVHIKLSQGSSFSGLRCFEYLEPEKKEWKRAEGDSITVRTNGTHRYKVRSVSKAGQRSSAADISVKFWKKRLKKPRVNCKDPETGGWYREQVKIYAEERNSTGPRLKTFITRKNLDTGKAKTLEADSLILCEEGRYHISVSQEDEAGNISKQKWNKKIYIDEKKPKILIKGETGTKYRQDSCRLEVSIKDPYLDADSIRWQTTGKVSNQRVKAGVLKADVHFEKEGEQKLSVSCSDQAGNFAESAAEHFFIDKTKPKLQISGVSALGIYGSAAEAKVVCTDDHPTEVFLYLNGKLLKKEKGKPGETVKTEYPRLSEDGYYCAEARAKDSAGNEQYKKVTFTVSCKGTQIIPAYNTIKKSSSGKKQEAFGFHIKNVVPSYVAEFLVNGRNVPYEKKGDYVYVSKKYLKNGSNQVKLQMKDMTGHVTTLKKPFVFHYDAEAPVILVSGVRNGNTYPEIKQIQIKVQDKQDRLTGLWIDNKRVQVTGEQAVIKCRTDGRHRIKAEAAGSSGLKSSKTVEFQICTKDNNRFGRPFQSVISGIYFLTAFYLIFFFFRTRKSKETS